MSSKKILSIFPTAGVLLAGASLLAAGSGCSLPKSSSVQQAASGKPTPAALAQAAEGGLFDDGAADHTQCALKRDFKNQHPSPAELAMGLGLTDAQIIPTIAKALPAGSEIVAAHRCTVNHREFLHVVLKLNGELVSISITLKDAKDKAGLVAFESKAVTAGADLTLHSRKSGEVEVAGIESQQHVAFISSSLTEDEHLGLSLIVGPVIRSFLARIEG